LGWLVAAAVAVTYLMVRYDVAIQEREPRTRPAALAAAADVELGEVTPLVDERYTDLAAAVQIAAGANLLAVERRLQAAEWEFPSDYRFTYERAGLAVYGRAEHHEAFYHLRKAAEKAIRTERAGEMLERLEHDGGPEGRLRRLAAGHSEWRGLHEALEHGDRDGLWNEHRKHEAKSAPPATQPSEQTLSARMRASSLIDSGEPCIGALVALQHVRTNPEAKAIYRDMRELCLRGGRRGLRLPPVPGPWRR
jgi:hypothetical protein